MNKPKILAIAPYEGLKELLDSLASKRDDFILDVYTGDLSDGAALVNQVQDKGFDIIISRGGTARMIREISHIPVIDIEISGYDMLRAFRLAQNYQGFFAIVGFPNITSCAHLLSDLLQYHVDIFTIHDSAEAEQCLEQLYQKSYTMIVGDVVTTELSKRLGMNSILITSGTESILSAFDHAVNLYHTIRRQNASDRMFKQLVCLDPQYIACYDMDQNLLYENGSCPAKIPGDQLGSYLAKQTAALKDCKKAVLTKRFGDSFCEIHCFLTRGPASDLAVFFVRSYFAAPRCEEEWISVSNFTEGAARALCAFYTNSPKMKRVEDEVLRFSKCNFPILIDGMRGTGKETIARTIHAKGQSSAWPFVTVDCGCVSPKAWKAFLDSPDSPFYHSSYCIFFKHAQALNDDMQSELIFYLENTAAHKRNRLLFSWCADSGPDYRFSRLARFLADRLDALTIMVPSLSERREDIASLASIHINELNQQLGKQIIGLEHDALALLKSFSWPGNLQQFHQVMNELILLTDAPYITGRTVTEVLAKQEPATHSGDCGVNLNQDLDHIITDVVRTVLSQEDGNQSRTAQRLGISRSTLWRRIRENDL